MKSNLEKLDDYFSRPPTKGQVAWGIIHDSCNIILHCIDKNKINVPQSFYDELEKLSPDSKIQDLADLFHKIGTVFPEWKMPE